MASRQPPRTACLPGAEVCSAGRLGWGERGCADRMGVGPAGLSLRCPSLNPWTHFESTYPPFVSFESVPFPRANLPISAHSWDRGPIHGLLLEFSVYIWALYLEALWGPRGRGRKPQGVRNPQQIHHSLKISRMISACGVEAALAGLFLHHSPR